MKRKSCFKIISVIMFYLLLPSNMFGQDNNPNQSIWLNVKKQAYEASKGNKELMWKKMVWSELKKLSPEELMDCSEEVCVEVANNENVPYHFGITTNAIFSYHAKKTSWSNTVKVASSRMVTTENGLWIDCFLDSLHINNHYKELDQGAIVTFAKTIQLLLKKPETKASKKIILLKNLKAEIWLVIPDNEKAELKKTIVDLSHSEKDNDLKRAALILKYNIEYIEWDAKREKGLEPLGEKPISPVFSKQRKSDPGKIKELPANVYLTEDGDELDLFDLSSENEVTKEVIDGLNKKKTIPVLLKMLEEEKAPTKLEISLKVLKKVNEEKCVPIIVKNYKTKYTGIIDRHKFEYCIHSLQALGLFAHKNQQAFDFLLKGVDLSFWDDLQWNTGDDKESLQMRLVITSLGGLQASKRNEVLAVLKELEKNEKYMNNADLKWWIERGFKYFEKKQK